ncbi:histone H3.v1-like [Macrobrachium nipponense]|uniref:histone H3.v1-like n=1 Tax=Macrobrachium nipponense TaxID=159736 RepID=UPI0030C7CCC5
MTHGNELQEDEMRDDATEDNRDDEASYTDEVTERTEWVEKTIQWMEMEPDAERTKIPSMKAYNTKKLRGKQGQWGKEEEEEQQQQQQQQEKEKEEQEGEEEEEEEIPLDNPYLPPIFSKLIRPSSNLAYLDKDIIDSQII